MSIIVQVGALRPLTSGPDSTLSVSPHSDDIDMSSGPSGDIYQRTVHTHSYPGCFGLPYQDHNYGAPPPITPPPSPTLPTVKINGHIEIIEDVSKPTLIAKEEIIDDSITRCICEFQHDDGYMICCDRCSVWQHIDCMGIDRNNIPDSYYCELCQIRPVDIERAKILQSRKKEELANLDTSATDTDPEELANRLAALEKKSPYKKVTKQRRNSKLKDKMGTKQKNGKDKKGLKKEKENLKNGTLKIKFKNAKDGPQKANKSKNRHNSQTVVKVNGDSWNYEGFDRFEDAKENQYSKDVQELFSRYNVNGINLDEKHCDSERLLDQLWCLGQTVKKQVIIEAKEPVLPGLAVLEYKGIVLLRQHYVDTNLFFKIAHPHVLFYSKFEDIDLCIDSSSYGNKARYIRRSCSPNAEVRHLVEHGRIHFVIFSTKEIDKGEEITIPFDYNYQECMYCVECTCLRNNCTVSKFWKKMTKNTQNKVNVKKPRMKRPSGSNDITIKTEQLSPLKNEILKIKESIPQSPSPVKTVKKIVTLPTTPIKQEPKSPVIVEKTLPVPPPVKQSPPKAVVKHTPKPHPKPTPARVKHDSGSGDKTSHNTAVSPALSTPEKLEAEEVDHKMTREERKMNAIMKAFEKLEKREERRKEALARIDCGRKSQDEPKKVITELRISSEEESKTCTSEEVSDSKDETFKPESPQKNQRKGRKRPLRRRSRVNSMSAAEPPQPPVETVTVQQIAQSTPTTPLPPDSASPGSVAAGFKFLKTKKHLFNEWLTEKGNEPKPLPVPPPSPLEIKVDETIFVPCLPSPRNAMDHLQRRNSQSAGCGRTGSESSTRGSAKKRWLRQAMHEVPSTGENGSVSPVLGCTSPNPGMCSPIPGTNPVIGSPTHGASPSSSPPVDFVTPLKKRRLARESLSQDAPILSSTPSTPSALVDMTTTINKAEGIDNEASSMGNIDNNVSGQPPIDHVTTNALKCYTSDLTESEAESSLSKVTVPDPETLTDSAENICLADNNSALNITADSGVVTDSHLETPEKMEVDVDKVTLAVEKSDSSSIEELKNQEIDLKKENIFDNLKNLLPESTVTEYKDSDLQKDSENCDGCDTSQIKSETLKYDTSNDSEMAVTSKSAEKTETASECADTLKSADINTPSDVHTSQQDFTSDNEATQVVKANSDLSCKSLCHNLGKTESFGFVPFLGINSVSPSKDVHCLTKEDQIETKSASDILSTTPVTLHLDNKMPSLEPSNQIVLANIPSSSLNKTTLSSEGVSDSPLDDNIVASPDLVSSTVNMTVSSLSSNIIPSSILNLTSCESASVSPPANEQTQPCKKKVSLLEYRKRLKTKSKETIQPQPTGPKANNSISSPRLAGGNYTSHTIRSRTLPSLPSLPLFTDRNKKKKEVKEKKSWHDLSLTERLRQEFGVEASEDGNKSDDSREGSLTPPPPPPPPCQTSPSPRLLKYLEGDDKTIIPSGVPPPPTAPHPGRGPATPPPPPPPPKSTANRIPSLMSLPFTTRTTTTLGVGATASQLLPLQTSPQSTAVLVNYPAQNGSSQGTSPQTLSYHHQVAVNPHQPTVNPTAVFPITQGTSPQSYSTSSNNNRYNHRYRRNSSPSTTSHHKGREVPFSHSYNHTSDTISRSEWSNGRRNTYSKYH